ncbi:MAG: hypothetical protein OEU26_18245 [Candidatus Tectomicrobia bacterium]|nr:hypothetical protein [Candidatus Tectomicrobia bacterium]
MPAIMADHDIEGQMQVLLRLLNSPEWRELWSELAIQVESFMSLGLPTNTPDVELWQVCQAQEIVLITGNRNQEDPASLEATL